MVKTLFSICISFLLLVGISLYETSQINRIFTTFENMLVALYRKSEDKTASHQDGDAILTFWNEKKRSLHIWIPHTSIETVDYQLNEALGYLFVYQYEDALPKIEVLIALSQKIPYSYSLKLENIL